MRFDIIVHTIVLVLYNHNFDKFLHVPLYCTARAEFGRKRKASTRMRDYTERGLRIIASLRASSTRSSIDRRLDYVKTRNSRGEERERERERELLKDFTG